MRASYMDTVRNFLRGGMRHLSQRQLESLMPCYFSKTQSLRQGFTIFLERVSLDQNLWFCFRLNLPDFSKISQIKLRKFQVTSRKVTSCFQKKARRGSGAFPNPKVVDESTEAAQDLPEQTQRPVNFENFIYSSQTFIYKYLYFGIAQRLPGECP